MTTTLAKTVEKALSWLSCIPAFRMKPWRKRTTRVGILLDNFSNIFVSGSHRPK